MRALVTGACGFVGYYLVDHLLVSGDEVLGNALFKPERQTRCPVEIFDLCDFEALRSVIKKFRPQVIYHLAGVSFVPEAEEDFGKALRSNVLGTSNIFRICHLMDLPCKIVFVSSAEVYGKIKASDLPIRETTEVSPANNYSLSKAMAELVAKRYGESGKVNYVTMRPFNHIGPGQDSRFVASSFARQLAQIKYKKIPAVLYVGNLEARRDFSDVKDIVRAYRLAAERGKGIYNLASGKATRIRDILDTLIEISGQHVEIKEDPSRMRAAEVPEVYGCIEKAAADLDWKPEIPLKDSLQRIFDDFCEKER